METGQWTLTDKTAVAAGVTIKEVGDLLYDLMREVTIGRFMRGVELSRDDLGFEPAEDPGTGPYLWRIEEIEKKVTQIRSLLVPKDTPDRYIKPEKYRRDHKTVAELVREESEKLANDPAALAEYVRATRHDGETA